MLSRLSRYSTSSNFADLPLSTSSDSNDEEDQNLDLAEPQRSQAGIPTPRVEAEHQSRLGQAIDPQKLDAFAAEIEKNERLFDLKSPEPEAGPSRRTEPTATGLPTPPALMRPPTNLQINYTSISRPPTQVNPWERIADLKGTISAYRQKELRTQQEIETLREEREAWRQERAVLTDQVVTLAEEKGEVKGELKATKKELRTLKSLFQHLLNHGCEPGKAEAAAEADKENDAPDAGEADDHM